MVSLLIIANDNVNISNTSHYSYNIILATNNNMNYD